MDSKSKIMIVDDHALFREGMKLLIEMEELGEVIAEAENGQEFIDLLEVLNPDLVIMDIKMPVMSGLEATQKSIAKRPALKILLLTMTSWKDNYSPIINSGAKGFVLKTSGKKVIENAIRTLINGENYFIQGTS
jgi:DNA-binding NarL/FixJ family response regulator